MHIGNRLKHVVVPAMLLFNLSTAAQEDDSFRGMFLGVGMGQDVGGIIGAKATYWVAPYLAGFIGGGWAVVNGGWNAGVEVRVPTRGRAQPLATAMYGYNGVIHIRGLERLDEIYYGPTIGAGILLKQRYTNNYWRFSLNVPFRPQEMYDDWEAIKQRPNVEVLTEPIPFTFGIGFHFSLRSSPPTR